MAQVVSSEMQTLLARYGIWLWIVAFGYASISNFVKGSSSGWLFVGVTLLLLIQHWFIGRKVVFVSFDDAGLRLSSLLRHDAVSWDDVQSIRPIEFLRTRPYRLSFQRPTVFGSWVLVALPFHSAQRDLVLSEFRSKRKLTEHA